MRIESLIFAQAILIFFSSCPAFAEDDPDVLTKQIFARQLKLIDDVDSLQRENMHAEWFARRAFIYNAGNSASTVEGLIAATALYWGHTHDLTSPYIFPQTVNGHTGFRLTFLRKPNVIKPSRVEATLDPQIVGQMIGLGFGLEFFLSLAEKLKRHHKQVLRDREVERLKTELNELLLRRLIASGQSQGIKRQTYMLEQDLLDAQSRVLWQTYGQTRRTCRSQQVFQQVSNAIAFSRNLVGGIGNILNVYAVHARKRAINADGNLLSVIAAAEIVASPYASNTSAFLLNYLSDRKAGRSEPDILACDRAFSALERQNGGAINKDWFLFSQNIEQIVSRQVEFCRQKTKAHEKIRAQEFLRSQDLGGTKLAQETMGLIVSARKPRGATRDNQVNAYGNTIYASGQSVNLSALVKRRLSEEIELGRMKRQGKDPASLVKANEKQAEAAGHILQAL